VIRRVVYWAKPAAQLPEAAKIRLQQGDVTAVLFFSAETARNFVRLLRSAGLGDTVNFVDAVTISDRASVALRTLNWRRISVASKPNQDAMLALLQ